MASSKDLSVEGSVTGCGDDDMRSDGKKKKFKPLSAMKKFFTKKREKKETVVAVKAKSTTALYSGSRTDDDDDDDGGFRSHPKPLCLAGTRSLSEDSVFSPEPRGQPIATFPKSAVSEESLPKSAFQSELLSKLIKRRSQQSVDDCPDDGLPQSPHPPATPADVFVCGPLKFQQHGQSGSTSNIRGSDQSLVSVGSSENEEEQLLHNKWKRPVPATMSSSPSLISDHSTDSLDLNSIQKTELLVNRAAKDKIIVKPHRRTARQSRKHRETSSTPPPLASLVEVSPTSSNPANVRDTWISGSSSTKTAERVTLLEESPLAALTSQTPSSTEHKNHPSDAPTSQVHLSTDPKIHPSGAPNSQVPLSTDPKIRLSDAPTSQAPLSTDPKIHINTSTGNKPNLSSLVISSKRSSTGSSLTSPSSLSPPLIVSATTVTVDAPTMKMASPTPTSTNLPQHKTDSHSGPPASSPSIWTVASGPDVAVSPSSYGKVENLSISERGNKTSLTGTIDASVSRLSQSQRTLHDGKSNMDIESRISQFQMPISVSKKIEITSVADAVPLDVACSDYSFLSDSAPAESVKEDYNVRRQTRSRTLPAVKDEQSSPKIQRSISHHIQNSIPDPQEEPAQNSQKDKEITFSLTASSTSTASLDSVNPENVQSSHTDSMLTSTSEPSWLSIVRKRKAEQEIHLESEKTLTFAAAKSGGNIPVPKSVFTSASYLDKKRGSLETVSYNNREISNQTLNNGNTKLPSVDLSAPNKSDHLGTVSVKREMIDSTEVSNLGSIKASRSKFDSSLRPGSQSGLTSSTPVTAERVKQFSGFSSGTTASTSSVVKPASSVGHEHISATTDGADQTKLAGMVGGLTHMRAGSVKNLPAKYDRSGSVQSLSTVTTTTEPILSSAPTSSLSSKADTGSVASLAQPPSSPPLLPSAPMHAAAQPSPSVRSQPALVTPLPFYVKPFTAYASKPATNLALAFRPANTAIQPDNKLVTTARNTTTTTSLTSNTHGIMSASSTAGFKSVSVSSLRPLTSPSVAVNVSTSVSDAALTASSPSPSTSSTATISSSSSSILLSASRHSSVRPRTSAASQPHVTHTSPSHPTTSSSINKSPSFKAAASSTEKVAPTEKGAPTEKVSTEIKKLPPTGKVPAWRTHLSSREVKIEIIENSPSTTPPTPSSTQTSSEILRKSQDKGSSFDPVKKTESSPGAAAVVEAEKATRRSSKVLDMVKNFQNLQAPS